MYHKLTFKTKHSRQFIVIDDIDGVIATFLVTNRNNKVFEIHFSCECFSVVKRALEYVEALEKEWRNDKSREESL